MMCISYKLYHWLIHAVFACEEMGMIAVPQRFDKGTTNCLSIDDCGSTIIINNLCVTGFDFSLCRSILSIHMLRISTPMPLVHITYA